LRHAEDLVPGGRDHPAVDVTGRALVRGVEHDTAPDVGLAVVGDDLERQRSGKRVRQTDDGAAVEEASGRSRFGRSGDLGDVCHCGLGDLVPRASFRELAVQSIGESGGGIGGGGELFARRVDQDQLLDDAPQPVGEATELGDVLGRGFHGKHFTEKPERRPKAASRYERR
jgi:hypothetical protein